MHQPRAIAVEDRQRRVEDVAHHRLEIVRPLDGAVHPIHALDAPPTCLALVLGPLTLGDIDHHAAQPDHAIVLQHQRDQVTQPDHTAVRGDHPVLEVVIALLADRRLADWHGPLAIFRVKVILPECRAGEPPLHGISENALGLAVHE